MRQRIFLRGRCAAWDLYGRFGKRSYVDLYDPRCTDLYGRSRTKNFCGSSQWLLRGSTGCQTKGSYVVPRCGSYADPRYIGLYERSTRDPTWIFSPVGLTWTYRDVTYGVSSSCFAAAALSDGNTQKLLILVRMSPESDSSDSESVEEAAERTTEKKSLQKDEEEPKRAKPSPLIEKDRRRSHARGRRRGRSASRGRDRRRRSRSHGKRKRHSDGRSGRDTERKARRKEAEPEDKGSKRPVSPPGKPPEGAAVDLRPARRAETDAGTVAPKVKCPHCGKKLTAQESGQKFHMYLNLYCIRCQLWQKLPEGNRTQAMWENTLQQAKVICAQRAKQDQRDAEAAAVAPTRSQASRVRKAKPSLPKALPLDPPSPSGGDTGSDPPEPEKPVGKSKKVSETLDQAESRAYEAADTDAAKQCCRLNRLIQTCLSPTWEMVSADPNLEKTILCAVSDWTDDWSRFKHCLTGYHMEEFRTVAADLKRLQEYLMLLPEASWAYAAETQVLLLLADCEALHPQGT
ncbi:unnamed protein product [Cladocopium goreaui]|uniref:Uncharacterized protein n=1 Tax=Cladocopium goreaui TaxID=2562237 RepID=A0A9P1FS11_9DINO|nr:unnamed protein product [Cladocopium goreaui]